MVPKVQSEPSKKLIITGESWTSRASHKKTPKHCSRVRKTPRIRTHWEWHSLLPLDVFLFSSGSSIMCYNQTVFNSLGNTADNSSTLLSPTRWLPGKSLNPSLEQPLEGPQSNLLHTQVQYPIHTRLLQVLASWILQTPGDRDYNTLFLGSLLHCLYGDSGKGTFQKRTELRNEWLTFKSGYCSEQFAGFLPSWGDKDSFTLLNTLISEPHCAGEE